MAPEQAQNPGAVDQRADIYALGILLFEALCGQRPFAGHNIGELIGAQLFQKAEKPSVVHQRKQLPPRPIDWRRLDAIIEKALAKAPSARFADCASLSQQLEAAWGHRGQWAEVGQGFSSQTSLAPTYVAPKPKSRWWRVAGVVLVVSTLAAGWRWQAVRAQRAAVTVSPLARAAARLQSAQRGGVAERRALVAAVELVRSRTLLPYVEAALRDPAAAVWPAAVPAAAAVGRREDGVLRELLTQRVAQAAGAIAVELAAARLRLGDQDAAPTLTAASSAEVAAPQLRATLALAMAGVVSAAVLQRVFVRCSSRGGIPPALRQAALLQLVQMGDLTTEKQLQQALHVGTTEVARDAMDAADEALIVFARAGRPAAQTQLVLVAQRAEIPRRLELAVALADAGETRAVELLLPLLSDATPRIRQRAAGALGSLGAAVATTALTALLDDSDPGVALAAAAALVGLSAPVGAAAADPEPGSARRGLPAHG